ncbi:uncharacterized protein LOC129954145 isoform X2 [Eupeodes corollae]|uniref:uncharacterized protein LOC129954145 isoform X2 n=1 Tax=Eupeodes corollae TaxID=290404 RepID=UPI002491A8CF|nr:uncharacterized protein LOC129954145 isoform X2 [Eupeodes corollae]
MNTGVIVDLSDDVEIENARRRLDRKRFNEIKKYIPFLEYITAKDPIKNEKYVKLLQWFNSNKNLPARVATTCEFAIKKRYKTLKSYMVFPPHILAIFEGGGEAIDLVSDDDDKPPGTSKNENQSSTKKEITAESTKDAKPSNTSKKSTQNGSNSMICIEELEVLSDTDNEVKDCQTRKNTSSISLSEISLNKPSTSQSTNHDDLVNKDLFDRIDNLDGNSVTAIVSGKGLERENSPSHKKSPILTPKNIESRHRKSSDHSSNISDDDGVLVQRKKKKKHKLKKKTQNHAKDNYDGSETENHESEKQKHPDEIQSGSSQKSKKSSKKKKEKIKNSRTLYVSDDDDESNQNSTAAGSVVASVKSTDSELFTRRDLSSKPKNVPTVVLLDSDEDEINNIPETEKTSVTNIEIEAAPSLESEPSPENIPLTVQPPKVVEEESFTNQLDTEKGIESSSPSKIKDLNSMGLIELNDIYTKLCEKTGIQLEELLGDLVNKSSIQTKDNSVTILENKFISQTQTNTFTNNDKVEVSFDSNNMHEEQFQRNHLQQQNLQYNEQMRQQNMHYLQQQQQFAVHQQQQLQQQQLHQQQFHQQQQHQEQFQNHGHCSSKQIQSNVQASYAYQNSLMPKLNLNDPRIVQKLKQIKDSPIHNLSIRESATLLMNCYAERPTYRSQSVVKVTSTTATTYGEHKRLKEMEKQERQKEKNLLPIVVGENSVEAAAVSPQTTTTTNRKARKDSSGSENGNKKNVTPNRSPSNSDSANPKRKISSDRESGRKTPKSRANSSDLESGRKKSKSRTNSPDFESGRKTPKMNTEKDDETVVMSFVGKAISRQRINSSSSTKSRQRNDSSSSTVTIDSVDMEQNVPINNTESNIRKVVQIVMSALGQTKEGSPHFTPSKSRKNSARKSTDSTKSDTKADKPEQVNVDKQNSSSAKNKKTKRLRRKTNDQLNKSPEKPKQSQPKRGCRELENLNCTFKEYSDIFEKCLLPTNDGKRLCSASGKKTPSFPSSDNINEKSKTNLQSNNSNESELNSSISKAGLSAAPIGKRRQTCSELQISSVEKNQPTDPIKSVFRRSSVDGKYAVQNYPDTESADETDEFDIEEHRNIKNEFNENYKNIDKDPFNPSLRVILYRLSENEIKNWTKCKEDKAVSSMSMPVLKPQIAKPTPKTQNEVIFEKQEFGEKPILVAINSKPVNTSKKTTQKVPTHLNNNISMTLNSTKTCVLCNKRPLDLTNHYVVQHQTESYTSRLTSEEIDNLEANIPLAVRHRNRYKVNCVFCQAELEDNFVNFHAHFSYHTGEYGFKCAVCDLVKPYREDIRSHQYRTSTCLNGKIRSNYLYSPDLVVIYLHVCNLCNFVQLNEANIHKHQRDHHGLRFVEPQNVKKCIIAALDNGEIVNEIMPNDQEEEEQDEFNRVTEKDAQNLEQEFLDEFPLDIKDVLLTEQEHQRPTTSQLAKFENLLQDINIDNEVSDSAIIAPSPKTDSEQLQSPSIKPASNIMTVIHTSPTTSNDKLVHEAHKPYIEPVDVDTKMELEESKPSMPMIPTRMVYRQMPLVSNYFGLYKCTLNDCWFSTNEAFKFIVHISFVHNSADLKIFLDCAYCHYKSTRAHNIVGHVRAKHSMCRYQCAECAYRSTIPGNVAVHRRIYHKNSTLVKSIYECGNRLSDLIEKPVNILQKMTENITSLKCQDCSKSFYAVPSLRAHIQKEHPLAFLKLNSDSYHELACLHCKETSNSKEAMRIHIALDHPDEVGYLVERKLRNKSCNDAVENLNVINISLPIPPADVYQAVFKEDDDVPNSTNTKDQSLVEKATPSKIAKQDTAEITIVEEKCITLPSKNVSTRTLTDEETSLRPLLEILTENTGAPTATLYRCPECVASFLHYELWQKHIATRHKIFHTASCPYCPKQFPLELAALHFESHRRHEYICFHCVTSFCSREKICEHFASFHSEFRATIERKIAYGDVSFSIFKEKDVSLGAIDWLPLFRKLSDALRQQLATKLQQNQHKEWLKALSASSLTDLEYLEIPKYIMNGLPRFKCLIRSCPFVGLDENNLDAHVTMHALPDKYKCSHCSINQNNPTWETIKNHKLLHKQEVFICCVCKFYHHSSSGISKHIVQFHNFRDVPVIGMWRDETKYKISLTIFLTERKMTFTTTDACFCCLKVQKHKLVYHLKKEHKVSLCPKCVTCDAIILTALDAEAHSQQHQSKPFKLKFEILTPFLYKSVVTSISPLTFETRLIKEKRPSEDFPGTSSKKAKPNGDIPVKIKEEVVIKEELEEVVNETPAQPVSIKCVNLSNLMENQTKLNQTSVMPVQPLPSPAVGNFQESVAQCYIPNYSIMPNNTGMFLPHLSPGIPMISTPQVIQFDTQTSTNLMTPQNVQHSIIDQQQSALDQSSLLLPELAPICGNCSFECSDFASLKRHFSTVHANERFLFRLSRRVECGHCFFQCSLQSMSTHHQAMHPDRPRLCRSIIDPNRCGVCHEIFTNTQSNNIQLPICACPRRQRILADCLDLSTFRLIQNFGHNYLQYKCDICNMSFSQEQICRQHIVQAHKKAIYPKLSCQEMMFVCFSCNETNPLITKIIEHIHQVHLSNLGETSIDMISSIYRKIKIIYPKGLTIYAGDLKSTRQCHDVEMFKHTLQNSDKI